MFTEDLLSSPVLVSALEVSVYRQLHALDWLHGGHKAEVFGSQYSVTNVVPPVVCVFKNVAGRADVGPFENNRGTDHTALWLALHMRHEPAHAMYMMAQERL